MINMILTIEQNICMIKLILILCLGTKRAHSMGEGRMRGGGYGYLLQGNKGGGTGIILKSQQ